MPKGFFWLRCCWRHSPCLYCRSCCCYCCRCFTEPHLRVSDLQRQLHGKLFAGPNNLPARFYPDSIQILWKWKQQASMAYKKFNDLKNNRLYCKKRESQSSLHLQSLRGRAAYEVCLNLLIRKHNIRVSIFKNFYSNVFYMHLGRATLQLGLLLFLTTC